ncbi:MAG: hypothetical protein OXK75_06695 [Gammaproteobacteria bacterium]|nr:hypothetical protein [Gammaproteobacteria bacterium]
MEIDWTIPTSIIVGGGSVLASAIISSWTALRIHRKKRKDTCIKQVRDRADAHWTVWRALLQIQADVKRESEEEHTQHVSDVSGIQWLRDYFRDNAALLDPELHDAYESALEIDFSLRTAYHAKFGKDINLPGMISIAKKKRDSYEQMYIEMGGVNQAA